MVSGGLRLQDHHDYHHGCQPQVRLLPYDHAVFQILEVSILFSRTPIRMIGQTWWVPIWNLDPPPGGTAAPYRLLKAPMNVGAFFFTNPIAINFFSKWRCVGFIHSAWPSVVAIALTANPTRAVFRISLGQHPNNLGDQPPIRCHQAENGCRPVYQTSDHAIEIETATP